MKRGKFMSENREKKWDERKLMREIVIERELIGKWMREGKRYRENGKRESC